LRYPEEGFLFWQAAPPRSLLVPFARKVSCDSPPQDGRIVSILKIRINPYSIVLAPEFMKVQPEHREGLSEFGKEEK
jgi:hypothetical protein